jgi:chromosomal replication initiator protein
MENVWPKVVDSLKEKIGQQNFEIWIKPINFLSIEGEIVCLEVPNRFFKDWINEHYSTQIRDTITTLTEQPCHLQFQIRNQNSVKKALPADPTPKSTDEKEVKQNPVAGNPFNPKYSFENFVVGSSNQFAHAACEGVAKTPGGRYNPLFIYGGVGLGKTHLLHAIGTYIIQKRVLTDIKRICYVSSEEFTNELINCLRYEKMDEFRNKYRKMDILLIDDIQFIAGKERTQAEFFFTFNTLYEGHKQIVVTSDKFPKDIPNFEERLRSRFEWGLIADIQPPDLETKVAILKKKAESENIPLPNDVAFFLGSQIESNIRMLEGSLIRVGAFASLTKNPIDMQMAKEVLKNIIKQKEETVSIESIQKVVAAFCNIKVSDLKVKRKNMGSVVPRQIAMYLSRKLTNSSLIEIGEKFGGKDHSTVLHSIGRVDEKMKTDPVFKETIDNLMSRAKS